MMNGVLLVDKPPGMTSHDIVESLRSLTHAARVGHAGTLDPNATGLLIVLLGKATKVSRFLMGLEKEYVYTVRLGVETDTLDRWGEVVKTRGVAGVTADDVLEVAKRFKGRYQQIAPSVSALKHKGVPLYRLARRGEKTPIKTRMVFIRSLEVLDVDLPLVTIRVACSSGTYVRSLARDMGQYLGCGGSVHSLRRMRVGRFGVDQAVALDDLTTGAVVVEEAMVSIEESLDHLPRIRLGEAGAARLRSSGQPDPRDLLDPIPDSEGEFVALADQSGMIIGIARKPEGRDEFLRTERLL